VGEDWLWHMILPAAAYGLLLASAIVIRTRAGIALFGVAATSLGLLFIGIHNAWDTVMYVVTEAGRRTQGSAQRKKK
jgi:hypothetical protein